MFLNIERASLLASWTRSAPVTRVACAMVIATLSLFGAGCNIVGPAAYIIHGPPKEYALHDLDAGKKTVIFVDDRGSQIPRRSLRLVIGKRAEETILTNDVINKDKLISSQSSMHAAAGERAGALLSVADIGQSVGAEVVIYVSIRSWTLRPDGQTLAPMAIVEVKALDVESNTRLWPLTEDGHPLVVRMPTQTGAATNNAELNLMHKALAELTGVQLARLFYTHERDTLSGSLSD